MHTRIAKFRQIGNLAGLLAMVAIAWGEATACRDQIVDVNGCGNYPPPGTCVLINQFDQNRGCCGICQRQHVKKEWYDCDGDGTADCEYDLWFSSSDADCCVDFWGGLRGDTGGGGKKPGKNR